MWIFCSGSPEKWRKRGFGSCVTYTRARPGPGRKEGGCFVGCVRGLGRVLLVPGRGFSVSRALDHALCGQGPSGRVLGGHGAMRSWGSGVGSSGTEAPWSRLLGGVDCGVGCLGAVGSGALGSGTVESSAWGPWGREAGGPWVVASSALGRGFWGPGG